jgi:putative DNA primase/helicase
MTQAVTPDTIRTALAYLPANVPRDEWVRIGMAIKSELPDEIGLALFEQWSSTAEGYDAKAVRSTWKSIKPGGGVTIATLLQAAQQNGFELQAHTPAEPAPPTTPLQSPQQAAQQRAAAQQREREQTAARHQATSAQALERWEQASHNPPEGLPNYLTRKGVQGYGLRYERSGAVLMPVRDAAGTLWNLQTIAATKPKQGSDKLFLSGGRKAG